MDNQEYVTEAWEAILKRAGAGSIPYRVSLVADAESACHLGIRSRRTEGGMAHEVFVVRADGTALAPFDRCVTP